MVVSAAASLTDVFTEVASAFQAESPDVQVVLNLAGSSVLREQILDGARVDVFASASETIMDDLVAEGAVDGDPVVFATNRLVIAVPVGNPGGVEGISDFADPDLLLGVCAEGVPCGDLAREVFDKAGIAASIDTTEPDVRALLTKIELGELDAGITYVTDVAAAGDRVEAIAISPELEVVAMYPIGEVAGSESPETVRSFIEFVLSERGRSILSEYGFGSP